MPEIKCRSILARAGDHTRPGPRRTRQRDWPRAADFAQFDGAKADVYACGAILHSMLHQCPIQNRAADAGNAPRVTTGARRAMLLRGRMQWP